MMFLAFPPQPLMPCREPVWVSRKHPQSCGRWEPACKAGAQGRGWLGMPGRGRAAMAALTATLEGALVPTDHRPPARGCAVFWKSERTAPSQQIPFAFPGAIPASIAPCCFSPLAVFPLPEPPRSGDAGQRCWPLAQPARASQLAAARPWQRKERRSEARPLTQPPVLSLPLSFYF